MEKDKEVVGAEKKPEKQQENKRMPQKAPERQKKQPVKKNFKKKFFKKTPHKKVIKKEEDYINPMDFWDMDLDEGTESEVSSEKTSVEKPAVKKHQQGLYVIGTDSGIGKTIAICALGTMLKNKGVDVSAMKPIECGGQDSRLFVDTFDMKDPADAVSVYSFKDKVSPYFSFKKQKKEFDPKKIIEQYSRLKDAHDLTFVEGAGGLLDPITDKYTAADLIKELGLHVVIVAPLKDGVLNHLMMIAAHAKTLGIAIQGILFTQAEGVVPNAFFIENMKAVREMMDVPVIGFVPFLEKGSPEEILEKCDKKISFKVLLSFSVEAEKKPVPPEKNVCRRTRSRGPRRKPQAPSSPAQGRENDAAKKSE